jgi:mannosyltransferase
VRPSRREATQRTVGRTAWLRHGPALSGPALLAAGLCLYGITDRSLGFDESTTYAIVSQHGAALSHGIAHDGGNMAGYYVLLHALVDLFGGGEFVLRLPSALAVGVAVLFTGALARRLFDPRQALIASMLTAVSMPLVFWGQGARSYALLVAFVAGSFLAFVVLVDERGTRSPGRRLLVWAAYVLASTLAMYMSLMAALALLAQLLTFPFWWRRRWRAVATAIGAIVVLCVPLALLATGRGSSQLSWVSSPTLTDFKQVFEALTGAGLEPSMRATATTPVLLLLSLAVLVAVAVAVALGLRDRADRQWLFAPALLLSWLVVPVAIAWAESLVAQPLFLPRNLLYCAPAVALLLAWALMRPRLPALLGIAGVTLLLVLRVLQLAPSYGVSPEDWQGATAYVLAHTAPGDCTLLYPTDSRNAFQYYLARRSPTTTTLPRPVLPRIPWSRVHPFVEDYAVPAPSTLTALPANCPRLWFISSHQGRRTGSPVARADYRRYVRLRATLEREYRHHSERLFGYASAIHVELLQGRSPQPTKVHQLRPSNSAPFVTASTQKPLPLM